MNDSSTRWFRNIILPSVATGLIIFTVSGFYRTSWGDPSVLAISVIGGASAFVSYFLYERLFK
jgi:hypothetical protein